MPTSIVASQVVKRVRESRKDSADNILTQTHRSRQPTGRAQAVALIGVQLK